MPSPIDHNYARNKLTLLLRDLDNYNGDEFWREMSRIAAGTTHSKHAEALQTRVAELEAQREKVLQAHLDHYYGPGEHVLAVERALAGQGYHPISETETLDNVIALNVIDFANEVWQESLRNYKTIRVAPLTMANQWLEKRKEDRQ